MVNGMICVRRSTSAVGVGFALLVVTVVCPVMAAAAASPVVSSCHERPDPHNRDGALDALTCCAAVATAASLQPADDGDTVTPTAFAPGHSFALPAADGSRPRRPHTVAPPLFVQHASLLI